MAEKTWSPKIAPNFILMRDLKSKFKSDSKIQKYHGLLTKSGTEWLKKLGAEVARPCLVSLIIGRHRLITAGWA